MRVIEILDNQTNRTYKLCEQSSNWIKYSDNITSLTCIVGKNGSGKTRFINSILHLDNRFELKTEGETDRKISIIKYSGAVELHKNNEIPDYSYDISTSFLLSQKSLTELNRNDSIYQVGVAIVFFEKFKELIEFSNKLVNIKLTDSGNAIYTLGERYLSGISKESDLKKIIKKATIQPKNIMLVLSKKFISILLDLLHYYDALIDDDVLKLIEEGIDFANFQPKEDFYANIIDYLKKVNLVAESEIDIESIVYKLKQFFKDINFFIEGYKESFEISKESDRNILKEYVRMMTDENSRSSISRQVLSLIEFEWNGLSSGELTLLNLFGRLHGVKAKVQDDILLLIDEVDLGLHPEWQRRWVSEVLPLIGEILRTKNSFLQVIISTHSPIILSDIFDKDIILLTDKSNSKTFGQNIYRLFQDSFFLDEARGGFSTKLIGDLLHLCSTLDPNSQKIGTTELREFSSKYDIRIEEQSEEAIYEYLLKIVDSIGEDVLRNHLKRQLKVIEYNFTLGDDSKDEIVRLKKRVKELEKELKNDKDI